MKKLSVIILSTVVFLACSKNSDQVAKADNEIVSQSAQVTRSISGQFQATVNPDPSIPPMPCTGDLPGLAAPAYFLHGSSTHLGEVIWQQSTLQHTSCNLSFATRQLTTSVSGQFAASNGDLLYYTGNDVIDVTNLLLGNGQPGTIQGTWTITGGTGRFEGVSGSITISGSVDFATLTFSFNGNGTITY